MGSRKEAGIMQEVLKKLGMEGSFSRGEFFQAMRIGTDKKTEEKLAYALRKSLEEGSIIRVGWNRYALPREKKTYQHTYTDASQKVAVEISQDYSDANFQLFELVQLNDFLNHQIAHNTIFVYVENELIDFVFDSLIRLYPGRVMLKPSVDEYYRYMQDDEIVVCRLPSESPKGFDEPWHSRLEKILVDIAVDKLLSKVVPAGEYGNIFEESFDRYLIDDKAMFRYAKRKGAEKKFEGFLTEYAPQVMEGRS